MSKDTRSNVDPTSQTNTFVFLYGMIRTIFADYHDMTEQGKVPHFGLSYLATNATENDKADPLIQWFTYPHETIFCA